MAAGSRAVGDDAAVLDAVRPREDEGEGQASHRLCGCVAGESADVHRLACPIDAALGPGVDVEVAGRGAAHDAAFGQVEAGRLDDVDGKAQARGHAQDRAGVAGDVGLVEGQDYGHEWFLNGTRAPVFAVASGIVSQLWAVTARALDNSL